MIDLRSDTVTRPTAAMRTAMYEAEVGDDVYDEDPTVNRLQALVAELLGKEAALFVTSGTQGNLCALMAHCGRGDEYLVGQGAHCFRDEAGGAAVLGSIQPQPLDNRPDGTIDLAAIEGAIKPDDPHFASTRLLCLENTKDGCVLPPTYVDAATTLARDHGLALHLDGARLWNAAAHLGVEPAELAEPFDTVSVCLSKGLGAPVGSVLVGSSELIARAYRHRKILGGAMRQAGVIAAAGIHAVEHHRDRMIDDHANAARLAACLDSVDGVDVTYGPAHTNMVFASLPGDAVTLTEALRERGVTVRLAPVPGDGPPRAATRLVTHLDVSSDDVATAAEAIASVV